MSILAFQKFYVQWLEEMKTLFSTLRDALQQSMKEEELASLVQACFSHYNMYTNEKIKLCQEDASFVLAGMWHTSLEVGFLWLGGWRPTAAVVLAYSLMGMQMESELRNLLDGIELPTMAALSARQLSMINSLQQKIRFSEDDLSNRFALLQMSLANQEMIKATAATPPPSESNDLSDVREAIQSKLSSLRDLLVEAEKVRGETVREMLDILRPLQAGQYALAAYEMAAAVKRLGNQMEGHTLLSELSSATPAIIRDGASQNDVQSLQKGLESGIDPS